MKIFKSLIVFTVLILSFSCKDSKQSKTAKVDTQSIEVNIEGMTCEIGCAKLIESKISKLEGVTVSKVNFEEKIGNFTFDANKISSKEIAKNINGIAGGDLYKATNIKTIE